MGLKPQGFGPSWFSTNFPQPRPAPVNARNALQSCARRLRAAALANTRAAAEAPRLPAPPGRAMFEQKPQGPVGTGRVTGARVRVPASTSNVGPGFDFIGLALSLYLEVEVRPSASAAHVLELGLGAEAWPNAADNLLLAGFERAWRAAGGGERRFAFRVTSEIPLGRGLGSSGAAIVAGLLLGAALAPRPIDRDELLRLAVELEGHPDNASPALLGGCVLALPRKDAAPRIVRQALHPSLAFAVAWPSVALETRVARGLLPKQVAFADAADNPRRLALLLEGLRTGERDLLDLGGVDRLHVPYRLPHIPGGERALAAARDAGAHLATISGSGSALFLVAAHESIERVARAARAELERASPPAVAHVVSAVTAATTPTLL